MKKKQARPRQRQREEQEPQGPTGDLMTPMQVAQYLGVRIRRVRNWERRRYLTPVVVLGERRYMTSEVEHLAAMYGR